MPMAFYRYLKLMKIFFYGLIMRRTIPELL